MADYKATIGADNSEFVRKFRDTRRVSDQETAAISRESARRAAETSRAWQSATGVIGNSAGGMVTAITRGMATVGTAVTAGIGLARQYGQEWEHARSHVSAFDGAVANLKDSIGADLAPLLDDVAGLLGAIGNARQAASNGAYVGLAGLLDEFLPRFGPQSQVGPAAAAEVIEQAEAQAAARLADVNADLLRRNEPFRLSSEIEIARLTNNAGEVRRLEERQRSLALEEQLKPLYDRQDAFIARGEAYKPIAEAIGGAISRYQEQYETVENARESARLLEEQRQQTEATRRLSSTMEGLRIGVLQAEGSTAAATRARIDQQYEQVRTAINEATMIEEATRNSALAELDALQRRAVGAALAGQGGVGDPSGRSIAPGLYSYGTRQATFGAPVVYGRASEEQADNVKKISNAVQKIAAGGIKVRTVLS